MALQSAEGADVLNLLFDLVANVCFRIGVKVHLIRLLGHRILDWREAQVGICVISVFAKR